MENKEIFGCNNCLGVGFFNANHVKQGMKCNCGGKLTPTSVSDDCYTQMLEDYKKSQLTF